MDFGSVEKGMVEGVQSERITVLHRGPPVAAGAPIVYWMSASCRASDNHALEVAAYLARTSNAPLLVVFALSKHSPNATERSVAFLLQGLGEVERTLGMRGIPFTFLTAGCDSNAVSVRNFAHCVRASWIVCDVGYTTASRAKRSALVECAEGISVVAVEANVVVPAALASQMLEPSAKTLRAKMRPHLARFLIPPAVQSLAEPEVQERAAVLVDTAAVTMIRWCDAGHVIIRDLDLNIEEGITYSAEESGGIDWDVPRIEGVRGGSLAARRTLALFLKDSLQGYYERRHDALSRSSRLSPYLHFGMISPVIIANAVKRHSRCSQEDKEHFLDELIIRRELAVNFVLHAAPDEPQGYQKYNTAIPQWARDSLEAHAPRPGQIDESKSKAKQVKAPSWLEVVEKGETKDEFWNICQWEVVATGFLHNYLRMYWCKQLLRWAPSPAEAYQAAVMMNDKYFLDGRDPNGYIGIAWCFGQHDTPFPERPVFGKVLIRII
jgi:deoxyribodipyrimidine photo-lyase